MSRQNGFLKLLSAVLSLFLALVLIAAIPIAVIDYMLSEDNIEIAVDYIFEDIGSLDGIGVETTEGSRTLGYLLLWAIKDCPGAEYITEKQATETLVPKFLKDVTADLLTDFSTSVDEGELEIGYKASDVYRFLEKNRKTVSGLASKSGYRYDIDIKDNKSRILNNVSYLLGRDGITLDSLLADGNLRDNAETTLEAICTLLNLCTVTAVSIVIGVVALLLFLVNLGYFGKFLTSLGTPAFTIGLICFILAAVIDPLISGLDLQFDGFSSAVNFIIGFIAAVTMDVSSVVLLVGLGLIILGAIVKALSRKKQ